MRLMKIRVHRSLWQDERGIGTIELIVVLVLVVSVAVSFWNLFGHSVACGFADAVDTFESAKRPAAAQCREPTPSAAGAASGGRGSAGRAGQAASGGRAPAATTVGGAPSTPPASSSGAALAGVPTDQVARVAASPSGSARAADPAPSLADRAASLASDVFHHGVDLVEGVVAGYSPLTPLVPQGVLKPSFGNEVTYGIGEVLGATYGLAQDAVITGGGLAVSAASVAVAVLSDGTTILVTGPLFVEGLKVAGAGAALGATHISNLNQAYHDIQDGQQASPQTETTPSQAPRDGPAANDGARPGGAADAKPELGSPSAKTGAKRGPKTDPEAPHNKTIREQADQLEREGNTIVAGGGRAKEQLVDTVGGAKNGRRPDIIYRTPSGELRGRNVGKVDAKGNPVPREKQAMEDLNGPGGLPTDFVPYNGK